MSGKPPDGTEKVPIDTRAKILAALMLIGAVVLTGPMGLAEFLVVILFVTAVVTLLEGSALVVLRRGLLVVPFAGAIALFAPLARIEAGSWAGLGAAYARHWPLILALLAKAYLSVLTLSALTATTTLPELLRGLRALRVPEILLTLFTFLPSYLELFRTQVASMRDAIASRAPRLGGWQRLRLYGSLGGNLLVRAYERGERIYDAMIARGYTGTLPAPKTPGWCMVDTGFITVGLAFSCAVVFYR